MNMDSDAKGMLIEAGSTEQLNRPRRRKRKYNPARPLDCPEEEAIAQHLAAPKSIREFKSFVELAELFNISRMTVYRRSKDLSILQRVECLPMYHELAGDPIARRSRGRIVAGQVKAAIAGDTKAAQFCKERAWPADGGPFDLFAK